MNNWLSDTQAKQEILEAGRRIDARGFVAANDGNISIRVGENAVWITPAGVSKGFMTEEMLVKIAMDGELLEGTYAPSSETALHLRIYREDPGVRSVVHAHPPVSTAFSVVGMALDSPVTAELVLQLGEVPLARYATPGTSEVADAAAPYAASHRALLLERHGALTWGDSADQAVCRMESVEHCARILLLTRMLGGASPLPRDEVERLLKRRGW